MAYGPVLASEADVWLHVVAYGPVLAAEADVWLHVVAPAGDAEAFGDLLARFDGSTRDGI